MKLSLIGWSVCFRCCCRLLLVHHGPAVMHEESWSGRYGWLRVCGISRYPAIVLFESDGDRWPCRLCPVVAVGACLHM